jgi:hypothetical protein
MRTLQTPSAPHVEFDQLCERVDEFQTLPDHSPTGLMREELLSDAEAAPKSGDGDHTPIDGLILAGLVSPV